MNRLVECPKCHRWVGYERLTTGHIAVCAGEAVRATLGERSIVLRDPPTRRKHLKVCRECGVNPRAYAHKRCPACEASFQDSHWAKARAWRAARRALRIGQLIARPCERCGEARTQMHHEDYSRPLDVTWLCVACHARRHVFLDATQKSVLAVTARS
jgi:hypothetical protein